MSELLRNKLLGAEMTPPNGVWEAIATNLSELESDREQKLGNRISQFELAPPALAWEAIQLQLEEKSKPRATVVSLKRWYYAAAAAVVLAFSIWLIRTNLTSTKAILAEQKKIAAPILQPITSVINQAIEKNPFQLNSVQKYVPVRATVAVQPDMIAVSTNDNNPEELELPASDISTAAKVESETVNEISAPLIKDDQGNIIYDTDLLKQSIKGNYISVTAPDGTTTRISTKFLNQLNYLHSNYKNAPSHPLTWTKNALWQWKFDQWKRLILNYQEFNPGATNFLDALELIELLNQYQ